MDSGKNYLFFPNSVKMISVETEKIYIAITKPMYLILVELTHLRIKSNTINTMILNLDFGQLMLLRLIFQFNFIS